MGFADRYLQKHTSGDTLLHANPDKGLKLIVAIPCYNESGLLKSLDSLFSCDTAYFQRRGISAEVLVFINASEADPADIHQKNQDTYTQLTGWIESHPHPVIRFYALIDNALPAKHAGVGLARKTIMDEAVKRFNALHEPEGIILSLDADARVETNYLEHTYTHLSSSPEREGCSIYFEHPTSGEAFDKSVYEAIVEYELHLRYYVRAIAFTGYPYASHTVGSCFGIKALPYCKQGGMNRKQGGEDFYFIQKIAQNGKFSACTSTRVIPSPRPSDRVPFGTGPAVLHALSHPGEALLTYNTALFVMLKQFFSRIENTFDDLSLQDMKGHIHPVLKDYLTHTGFEASLKEIRSNSASPETYVRRFWRHFTMFRILKFLHFARGKGFEDLPVYAASRRLLDLMGEMRGHEEGNPMANANTKKLLHIYRDMDRRATSFPLQ